MTRSITKWLYENPANEYLEYKNLRYKHIKRKNRLDSKEDLDPIGILNSTGKEHQIL